MSIVVSAADKRAIVLRNGVLIGSAPVTIAGPVTGTWAYALQSVDASGQHWVRVPLSLDEASATPVPLAEWQRFQADPSFRKSVAAIVQPGTTVIVTADSLRNGGKPATILDAEPVGTLPQSR